MARRIKELLPLGYPSDELYGYQKDGRTMHDCNIKAELLLSFIVDHNMHDDFSVERFQREIREMLENHLMESSLTIVEVEAEIGEYQL